MKCPRCNRSIGASGVCHHCLLEADVPSIMIGDALELGDEIGSGGQGTVFEARHIRLGRKVAVKFLAPELSEHSDFRERFAREARALALLSHPNIVTVHDYGEEGGQPYLVMELVDGHTLSDMLPVPRKMAINVALQICEALAYAHEQGVVHRDIKPANVLISKRGDVKMTDFGIARIIRGGDLDLDADVTATGIALGTPQFMSPEALAGGPPDPRMDIYSAGVLLHLMLTGELPWDDVEAPTGLMGAVVRKALAKVPEQRYQTAHALRDDLESARLPSASRGRARPTPATLPEGGFIAGSPTPRRTNLAGQPTEFIGRSKELATLQELIDSAKALVTLVGPPGVGKTRLAQHHAAQYLDRHEDREVWFCDLTKAATVDGICTAIARAMEVSVLSGTSAGELVSQLATVLSRRGPVLIILDNFEHVVTRAPDTLTPWMIGAPNAQFIVTSRESLKIPGEVTLDIGTLSPADSELLFVDRVRAIRPGYKPNATDQKVISEIASQLDGLPLAIELAAARMKIMTPVQLSERIVEHSARVDVLGGARQGPSGRQVTLRGAIDWSWSLLEDKEQTALAQASVFRGGFSLEAAEAVMQLGTGEWDVLDVIEALRDKSLVRTYQPDEFPGTIRFGLYGSIREYAAEKLNALGSQIEISARHAAYYLNRGEGWAAGTETTGGELRMKQLELELPNFIAIHKTAGDGETALRAALVMEPIMFHRGPHRTWRRILEDALNRVRGRSKPVGADATLLGRGLQARARVLGPTDERSHDDLKQALEIAREVGDRRLEARVLSDMSSIDYTRGRLAQATAFLIPALAISHDIGDRACEGLTLTRLGVVLRYEGKLEEAHKHYEQARRILNDVGAIRLEGNVISNQADLLHQQNRLEEARRLYVEALVMHRRVGNRRVEATCTGNLAGILQELRQFDRSRQTYTHALELFRSVGDARGEALFTGARGTMEQEAGDFELAREYLEESLEKLSGNPEYRGLFEAHLGSVLATLGDLIGAQKRLDDADETYRQLDNPLRGEVVRLLRAHLDIASGDRKRALQRVERAQEAAKKSDEVRVALRTVRQALAR